MQPIAAGLARFFPKGGAELRQASAELRRDRQGTVGGPEPQPTADPGDTGKSLPKMYLKKNEKKIVSLNSENSVMSEIIF